MRKLLLAVLVLLVLLATLIFLAPKMFDASNVVKDWQPSAAPAIAKPSLARPNCDNNNVLGNAYFGDLHIHTAYSMDARSRDMLGTPSDAYRFAQGFQSGLGPFDANGNATRPRQLDRPLDFAAVTDHAEWIGEINLCTKPGSVVFDTEDCRAYRGEEGAEFSGVMGLIGKFVNARMVGLRGINERKSSVCGADGSNCRDSLKAAWLSTQAATEAANDTSSECQFTSFHGWEFSDGPGMSKVHRNVVFRNDIVPEIPISAFETPGPVALWQKLDRLCNNTETGCEAITIPHNSNVSNGRMFTIPYKSETLEEQQRLAAQRARYEPIVEMMQIKGESECKADLWGVLGEDEQCGFEKIRGIGEAAPKDCELDSGSGAIMGLGCQSRLDFARYALIEGLVEKQRIDVNPYRFGLVGGTDNHNAAPGDVSESNYEGCCANSDSTVTKRLSVKKGFAGKGPVARNPGGLMGVWASQNTRDDLFDAMQRREVFATSGPRIQPRFFAGWHIDENICDGSVAQLGYAGGVPMGAELATDTQAGSPLFVASAVADLGTSGEPGTALQRLQIIKLWHDTEGQFHQQVHDIAGNQNNGAGVDLDTCASTSTTGAQTRLTMCATWRDVDYSAQQSAAYYVRVLENPSCRWSWRHCISQPESERSQACQDETVPKIIQERAWTSPIWLTGTGS
ncbi:MAG: DUF3604 domain-containing protein [Pseudomonadales bacterium]